MKNPIYIISLLCTLIFSNLSLAFDYEIIDLGTLGGNHSDAWGINNLGQIAGYSNLDSGNSWRAFIWDTTNGMQNLGTLTSNSGVSSARGGINDLGIVVGKSSYPNGLSAQHAFIWDSQNGMKDIDNIGPSSESFGINNLNKVVGRVTNPAYGYETHAFIWSSTGGMQDLGPFLPFPSESGAYDINDLNQVVGYSYFTGVGSRAFIWDSINGMQDIGTLGGGSSTARSINESAQVVGYALQANGFANAFLWDSINGMRSLGTLGGNESEASAINDYGQIVGRSQIDSTSSRYAFIYDKGQMTNLNDLIDPSLGWVLDYAEDINNSGQIVGQGYTGGEIHAYLLNRTAGPVPEPATLLLLGFGLMGLVGLRKKYSN